MERKGLLDQATSEIRAAQAEKGQIVRRKELGVAVRVAYNLRRSTRLRDAFERAAKRRNIQETRAGSSEHLRLLKYLGVGGKKAPPGSLKRYADVIELCLKSKYSPEALEQAIATRGHLAVMRLFERGRWPVIRQSNSGQ